MVYNMDEYGIESTKVITLVYKDPLILWFPLSIPIGLVLHSSNQLGRFFHTIIDNMIDTIILKIDHHN